MATSGSRGSRTTRDSRGRDSRGRDSRGRAGGGGGGGGNNANAIAMVIAGVVIVIVILVVVMMNKKSPSKNLPPPPEETVVKPTPGPEGPKAPVKAPLPTMPPEILQKAKALVPAMKEAGTKGMALYDEAIKAKDAGDADTWQAKMEEAREILKGARDEWNEIEGKVQDLIEKNVPAGWTADDATQAMFTMYLKSESETVRNSIDVPIQKMAKTGRSR